MEKSCKESNLIHSLHLFPSITFPVVKTCFRWDCVGVIPAKSRCQEDYSTHDTPCAWYSASQEQVVCGINMHDTELVGHAEEEYVLSILVRFENAQTDTFSQEKDNHESWSGGGGCLLVDTIINHRELWPCIILTISRLWKKHKVSITSDNFHRKSKSRNIAGIYFMISVTVIMLIFHCCYVVFFSVEYKYSFVF